MLFSCRFVLSETVIQCHTFTFLMNCCCWSFPFCRTKTWCPVRGSHGSFIESLWMNLCVGVLNPNPIHKVWQTSILFSTDIFSAQSIKCKVQSSRICKVKCYTFFRVDPKTKDFLEVHVVHKHVSVKAACAGGDIFISFTWFLDLFENVSILQGKLLC